MAFVSPWVAWTFCYCLRSARRSCRVFRNLYSMNKRLVPPRAIRNMDVFWHHLSSHPEATPSPRPTSVRRAPCGPSPSRTTRRRRPSRRERTRSSGTGAWVPQREVSPPPTSPRGYPVRPGLPEVHFVYTVLHRGPGRHPSVLVPTPGTPGPPTFENFRHLGNKGFPE